MDTANSRLTGQVNMRSQRQQHVIEFISRLVSRREGQDLLEYGLLIGIVTVSIVLSIPTMATIVGGYFANLVAILQG
jgi:Flp pilus assembly pilin Flp